MLQLKGLHRQAEAGKMAPRSRQTGCTARTCRTGRGENPVEGARRSHEGCDEERVCERTRLPTANKPQASNLTNEQACSFSFALQVPPPRT